MSAPQEKKLLDPESPIVRISTKTPIKSYLFICKIILKKFGNCELNSLGRASQNVVRIAESLQRNSLATIDKIESGVKEVSDKNSETGMRSELAFIVKMTKTDKFDEICKDLK